ncbi:MAG: hypothetical protein IPG74_17985 [Flavobacteriales bacterium]|nr:hypothetical protein [Flavobacteriales bacterium]MBK7555651.1 hypothetical protein [Flavobacteriales bacterium]MBK9195332.1 hypothetical protein [Flavobacteriales bacterium]MBP6574293.1 hypothetical protein [Flavobacteriales bacterium]
MFDKILDQLKSQVGPQLMQKAGLNEHQTNGSINAAAASVREVVGGGDGFGMDDVLNLFSADKNNINADNLLSNIGNVFQGKLTSEVGLDAGKASSVSALVMPMLTKLLSDKIGGNAGNLQSLLGNLGGGGIADMAKGFLGNLFK